MESAVDPFGVIEYQVINEPSIEVIWIGQKIGKVIDKLFLDVSVKSFNVSIHLGALGIGMVMNQMKLFQPFGKVFLEFGAIVS